MSYNIHCIYNISEKKRQSKKVNYKLKYSLSSGPLQWSVTIITSNDPYTFI